MGNMTPNACFVAIDMTRRSDASDGESGSAQTLRRLSSHAAELRERDGRRIARELHDVVGQKLTAVRLELSSLGMAAQPECTHERIDAMVRVLDDALAALRKIASDLRPVMLDDLGLNAAIEWLAREAARNMDIEITVRLGENEPVIDERVATAIYRIVQEALVNVDRHARATDVQITLQARDQGIQLTVQDNGVGFPERAMQKLDGLGLLGARERAVMLGGRLDVGNPPGQGGRMTVWLPLQPPAPKTNPKEVAT